VEDLNQFISFQVGLMQKVIAPIIPIIQLDSNTWLMGFGVNVVIVKKEDRKR
jgi:hypothetical protein